MRTKGCRFRGTTSFRQTLLSGRTYHPDYYQGFAVTGDPCRSTFSNDLCCQATICVANFFSSYSGRHSAAGNWGALSLRPTLLCQRPYTYSSQRANAFSVVLQIIPIDIICVNGRCTQYL